MRVGVAASTSLVLVVLLGLGGCGGNSASLSVSTAPVKGKVTYKGIPLTRGSISFEPESGGREANGNIQPDGTFALTTYKEGDGAVIGTNRIAISSTSRVGKSAVPVKFRNYSSSKIEVEVAADKTDYLIELK